MAKFVTRSMKTTKAACVIANLKERAFYDRFIEVDGTFKVGEENAFIEKAPVHDGEKILEVNLAAAKHDAYLTRMTIETWLKYAERVTQDNLAETLENDSDNE